MNNKEDIECIRAIKVQMFNNGKESKWTKACDKAIKALLITEVIDKGFKRGLELMDASDWNDIKKGEEKARI